MTLHDTIASTAITSTIERHGMLSRGRRIGVAVSGGADSVFLLHALREAGLASAVLHVNHKLRGADSDGDESFVAELAGCLGLPFHIAVRPVPEGNVEQEARRARYAFFRDRVAAGDCDAVATGHTLDDQAETVLSRFLRGAGTAGLSGIRPVTREGIVRPLLGVRREEIRAWLRGNNVSWREDCTNAQKEFLRNRLRLDIMPQLATLNPSLADVLASTAEWARAEEAWWDAELDRLECEILDIRPETVLFQTAVFLNQPVAVQRRLLRRAVERVKGSLRAIDFHHIEAVRGLTQSREGSGRIQLPGLDVYRSFDWLRLAPVGFDSRLERDFETPLNAPGVTILPNRPLTIEMQLVTPATVYNGQMDVLDWERCEGPLTLRNWRPGDSYAPLDESGSVSGRTKIKTLFQENRVPLWERRHWPVIVSGASIVWARRFGVAGEFAAGPSSRRVLAIREISGPQSGESKRISRASIEAGGSFERTNSLARARSAETGNAARPGEPGAEVL
jgi:tRNA(Ile)-lysidine synthase